MSIGNALNNALSGLSAASRTAEVVSSNLSNALTDGYGRRSLELSAHQVGSYGSGVTVEGVNRFVDAGILADRRLADAELTGQQNNLSTLTRLEQTLGGPDDATSLNARLAAFEGALISASSDPASELRLENAMSRLTDVTDALKSNSSTVQSLRAEADAAIANDIETLNTALLQVEALNADILRLNGSGNETATLLDVRQTVVDQIADIVPVREIARDNGTIALMTTSGTTLIDGPAAQFGFEQTHTITANLTFASGFLSGITLGGEPLDSSTAVGRLDGGSLGAAFAMRDNTLVDAQDGLDEIAADLIARFQDPDNDPSLVTGDLGVLTDEGVALDVTDIEGIAARISINAAVDPAQGGDVTLLRDGLNATTAGPVGSATQLNLWIEALSTSRSDVAGTDSLSASGRTAAFGTQIGSTRLSAEQELSFTAARWDTLHEAELVQGVDTDFELQTLLLVEQAYAANAKVIETIDYMMQRLMEL